MKQYVFNLIESAKHSFFIVKPPERSTISPIRKELVSNPWLPLLWFRRTDQLSQGYVFERYYWVKYDIGRSQPRPTHDVDQFVVSK